MQSFQQSPTSSFQFSAALRLVKAAFIRAFATIPYNFCNALLVSKQLRSHYKKAIPYNFCTCIAFAGLYFKPRKREDFGYLFSYSLQFLQCFVSIKVTESRTIKKLFPTIFAHVLHLQDYISNRANVRISAIYDSYSLQFLQCFVSVKATESRTIKKLFPTFCAMILVLFKRS